MVRTTGGSGSKPAGLGPSYSQNRGLTCVSFWSHLRLAQHSWDALSRAKPGPTTALGSRAIVAESFDRRELDRFAIGFDHRDRVRLHALWDQALDSERWSEGDLTRAFESAWAAWNGL